MKRRIFYCLAIFLPPLFAFSQTAIVTGVITSEDGSPLPFANVYEEQNHNNAVQTDVDGSYKLTMKPGDSCTVVFSTAGYKKRVRTVKLAANQVLRLDQKLETETTNIKEVLVVNKRERESNMTRINPTLVQSMPGIGLGSVETGIKTLPGVVSRNEFSSQYNVRGGNFDENLVYVNDIMIYRPILIRSGQQEGMSFINPDMVGSITFSSGGFGSEYGDRMSSVLDVAYRKPVDFGATVSVSLLGASGEVESVSKNKKFTQISGIRYKNNGLILKTLDEKGEYHPRFGDFQTQMTYQWSEKSQIGFLGYFAVNDYQFVPKTKTVTYGYPLTYQMDMFFDGNERDQYTSAVGALWNEWKLSSNARIKGILSTFTSNENENYDIISSYRLGEVVSATGSSEKDSAINLTAGSYFKHARNDLQARIIDASVVGEFERGISTINTGVSVQSHSVDMDINEWVYVDSAGYNMPYSDTSIDLGGTMYNRIRYDAVEVSAFAQNTWRLQLGDNLFSVNAGLRGSYKNTSEQYLASPRVKLSFKPDWKANMQFRIAWGFYYQPAAFKEMLASDGIFYEKTKAQKSIHYLIGGDYYMRMWERPFKLTVEAYYKDLINIIPYVVDNVRIQYDPTKTAKGYARGIDAKLNGEFVKGIDSWISISYLKTMEDIEGDGLGLIRRPSDQRLNLGLFLQDYLPWDNSIKMYITFYHSSKVPTSPPVQKYGVESHTYLPSYQRVDLGISKQILSDKSDGEATKRFLSSLWASLEVLNVYDKKNVSSIFWVKDVEGAYYPTPNYLTGILFNVKITAKI